MKTCTACNLTYDDDKKFCKHCGNPLASSAPSILNLQSPAQAEPPKKDTPPPLFGAVTPEKKCRKCPAPLDPDANFCGHCGEPVAEQTGQEAPPPPPFLAQAPPPPQEAGHPASSRGTAPDHIISHWYKLFEGLEQSPLKFYEQVEQAVRERSIPDIRIARVDWREAGLFSAKRVYLRVTRKDHMFDICGAPFANGFFISWWLGLRESGCLMLLASLPYLDFVLRPLIKPMTYYQVDTALMFQTAAPPPCSRSSTA